MNRGLEVSIATTDADLDQRLEVTLDTSLVYKGVPTIFFAKQWSNAFYYSRPFSRWINSQVRNYDLVHIHAVFSHASIAAARASRSQNVPYVIRPLGTLDPWSMKQKPFRKKLFWKCGVKSLVRNASAIHYTSENECLSVEQSLKLGKGAVIPLGVEIEADFLHDSPNAFRRTAASLGDAPYIILLSRLHPKKGVDILLRAFLDLTREPQFAKWKLVVAGEGDEDYLKQLKQLISERDGQDRVIFPGWLQGQMKFSALQGAAALVLPSHHENFGVCVAEAMACGIPVVISENVNLAPAVQAAKAGWVTTMEPSSLRAALADALSHEEDRKRRGEAARILATKYTWTEVAGELESLYKRVLEVGVTVSRRYAEACSA
jgi:glycosyltransferase involved in cell wall biosynthesis